MINSGTAIMGHYYGIPSMRGGLSSDAKGLDVQAGYEKAITAVPLLLEGAGIIYGVGATDAGAAISYSQITPRGNFLKAKHTKKNYTRHWQPEILNKEAYETWLESGESLEKKCRNQAKQILKNTNPQRYLPILNLRWDELSEDSWGLILDLIRCNYSD